ncbi:MAG: DUF932 domain-containing protein [Planctomycetota bacterium]
MGYSFAYGIANVRDLIVTESQRAPSGKLTVNQMRVDHQTVAPTPRFWTSFFHRYGVSESIFRYFQPVEVFNRIAECVSNEEVRYCVERHDNGRRRLLAVSNPDRAVIRHGEVVDLVNRYDGVDIDYADGVVTSTHTPGSGERSFTVGGDHFQHRFVLETPIDGYSHPKIYLSFLRTVCSNGMVGYDRAFRSDISWGKDIGHCISRALDGFDNGEGYAALRQRFESAQKSWASVRECSELYKLLAKMSDGQAIKSDHWLRDFHRMTGNLSTVYGLANLDAISQKRQRLLPARCRVYDLLNFSSEMATHRAEPQARRSLQGFLGNMISDEYDMEGTAESVADFADFFVQDAAADAVKN